MRMAVPRNSATNSLIKLFMMTQISFTCTVKQLTRGTEMKREDVGDDTTRETKDCARKWNSRARSLR